MIIAAIAAFLLVNQTKSDLEESEYSTTPTQWSQAGDYKIEETPEGTIVTNSKAGFSFKIPKGWRVEEKEVDDEFWLSLLSPDVKFDENGIFAGGCGINVEVINQEIEVANTKTTIQLIKESPEKLKNKTIIAINNHEALQVQDIPASVEILEKIGERVRIYIPIDGTRSINFTTQFLPSYKDKCHQYFQDFLDQVLIN